MDLRSSLVRLLAAALLSVFAFGGPACCAAAAPEPQQRLSADAPHRHHSGEDRSRSGDLHIQKSICASLCGVLLGAPASDRRPGDWAVRTPPPASETTPGAGAAPATPPPRA